MVTVINTISLNSRAQFQPDPIRHWTQSKEHMLNALVTISRHEKGYWFFPVACDDHQVVYTAGGKVQSARFDASAIR